MKSIYAVNVHHVAQPTFNTDEWMTKADFLNKASLWQYMPKEQAMRKLAEYEVIRICYVQVRGYCKVISTHSVAIAGSTGSEIDKLANALQRVQDKHKAKVAMYEDLLQHLLHKK